MISTKLVNRGTYLEAEIFDNNENVGYVSQHPMTGKYIVRMYGQAVKEFENFEIAMEYVETLPSKD